MKSVTRFSRFLFMLLVAMYASACGHFKDTVNADGTVTKGAWLYSDGVWIFFIAAAALFLGGLRVFSKSSKGGSISGGNSASPITNMPSLPWYKSVWGWILTIGGVGLALTVIAVQNYNR